MHLPFALDLLNGKKFISGPYLRHSIPRRLDYHFEKCCRPQQTQQWNGSCASHVKMLRLLNFGSQNAKGRRVKISCQLHASTS